jgi:uncharacterized protein YndB with AHSA1/START domain
VTLALTLTPMVKVGMLMRRPSPDVFQAFVDPAITTRFWFTKSSGALGPGATVRWEWEMYGAATEVTVQTFEPSSHLVFEWGLTDARTIVEVRLVPWHEHTYVQIVERGFTGSADHMVARVADSTGGFSTLLCAMKAFLEHGLVLTVVRDHHPAGLELPT